MNFFGNILYFRILVVVFCFHGVTVTQTSYAQTEASQADILNRFERLDSITDYHFKRHRIPSLKEKEIEYLLDVYFEQIDLLPKLKGHLGKKFYFHRLRGLYFKRIDIVTYSNWHHLKTIQVYDSLTQPTHDDKYQLYFAITELAGNYQKINKMDSATYYYHKVIRFSKNHIKEQINLSSAYNNLGMHYLENLYEADSAMVNFQRSMQLLDQISNNKFLAFRGSIRDNMANAYLAKNQLGMAKQLFAANFKFYHPNHYPDKVDYERWARAGLQVVETSIKMKALDTIDQVLKAVDSIIINNDFVDKQETRIRYLEAMEELYSIRGMSDSVAIISKGRKQLQGDLLRRKQEQRLFWDTHFKALIIKRLNDNFIKQQQVQKAKQKAERSGFWIAILGLSLMFSISLIIFIVHRQRTLNIKHEKRIADQELGILTLENNLLNEKIETRKKDLSDFALNLSQNQEWTQALLQKLEAIIDAKGKVRTKKLRELEHLVAQKVNLDTNTQDFYNKIDQLSNEFYSKLYHLFPDLTKVDIKLCSMIRLGYDISDIAKIQNIHFNSVYQSRYRIKRKMKLNDNQSLDEFLKQL